MRRSGPGRRLGHAHAKRTLLAAGADFVAVWPQEIVAQLLPAGFAGQACGISSTRSCGCQAGPSSPCECDDARPAEAGAMRRERALSRANALASALHGTPPAPAPAAAQAARRADERLLRSLARLRAAQGGPP